MKYYEVILKGDTSLSLKNIRKFLKRNKLVVWFTAVLPIGAVLNVTLVPTTVGLIFTILQMTAFCTMFWIGWDLSNRG